MTDLLTISSVSKRFGDTVALDDVSLTIRHNEFFALLGPSGCGKTTLLRAIAGFASPDSGAITIDDGGREIDLLALAPNRRPVNLMFQSYALFPHMSVERNVAYGLEQEKLPKDEIGSRVQEVLRTVGLVDRAKARPSELSGGQRQRVALARAIVKRPRLLLLDEPLSALDRKVRAEVQLELKRLQTEVGITFVVVTHDQEEAMSMADRIAVLHEGRVQQVASPVDLYRRPETAFVADFIGTSTMLRGTLDGGTLTLDNGTRVPLSTTQGRLGAATVMLRPEDIEVVEGDRALLTGTVVESHFFGGSSTTHVVVPGVAGVVTLAQPGAPRHAAGATVHLAWPIDRAVLLPQD